MTAPDQPAPQSLPNLKAPTLGGKQFWTDFAWRQGWRIQQNAVSKHWRLLDANNVRQAWGNRPACEEALLRAVPENRLANTEVVVLLHGLGRSTSSMNSLAEYLDAQMQCTTLKFEYASSRASISEHAGALNEVLQALPDTAQLHLIGHSMGNIVARHWIGDLQRANNQAMLQRVHHVVMLGPPNQGAAIARQLSKVGNLFEWITGEGGMELGPKWSELEQKLATPHCPFGIVAGNLPDSLPANPLVGAASDFVVSVDETRLAGEADFLEVPKLHSFLMDDPTVQKAVASFLHCNRFECGAENPLNSKQE